MRYLFLHLLCLSCTALLASSPQMPPPWPDGDLPSTSPAGYNAPAGKALTSGWDLFTTASFLYWYVSQDYMDVGRSAAYHAAGSVPAPDAKTEYPDFGYQPGFKVGVGLNSSYDGWYAFAEYIWLHQETDRSSNSLPTSMQGGDRVWIPNDWFNTLSSSSQAQAASLHTFWKMHLDMADLGLCRPFYEGRWFTVSPKAGLRGLWIRQEYKIDAYNALNLSAAPAYSLNRSACWSIGPNIGAESYWLLGKGFNFQGSLSFSLLYTQYTTLSHKEYDSSFSGAALFPINGTFEEQGCLRSISQLGIGAGWGTYLKNHRYHVSLSAQYDFALFWAQNMMRETVSSLQSNLFGYPDPAGDLSLHGLTIDGRFDF